MELDGLGLCFHYDRNCYFLCAEFYGPSGTSIMESAVLRSGDFLRSVSKPVSTPSLQALPTLVTEALSYWAWAWTPVSLLSHGISGNPCFWTPIKPFREACGTQQVTLGT